MDAHENHQRVIQRRKEPAGECKVLPGGQQLTAWVRKSPKKPPVRAPMIKVLTPHKRHQSEQVPHRALGRVLLC